MFGTLFDVVTQPIRDVADVLDGLSEGEIRTKAIGRLGAEAVAVMTLSEIVDYLLED